tara:strand:- start:444 stop:677 length:234 start_codon:yes stop_codon:yes gene_type:complete
MKSGDVLLISELSRFHRSFLGMVNEVSNCIKQTLKKYMNTPKKDGGQRIDKSIRHFAPSEKFKEERKDNWDIMFQQP